MIPETFVGIFAHLQLGIALQFLEENKVHLDTKSAFLKDARLNLDSIAKGCLVHNGRYALN